MLFYMLSAGVSWRAGLYASPVRNALYAVKRLENQQRTSKLIFTFATPKVLCSGLATQ
jgi:hypothetical protein